MVLPASQKLNKKFMYFPQEHLPVLLNNGIEIELTIFSESREKDSLVLINELEAAEYGEARLQIMEGLSYEYQISHSYQIRELLRVVTPSKVNRSTGRITPNIFVGTLNLEILENGSSEVKGTVSIEVRSMKTSYREDYRFMLEDITEKCTDLLMQYSSPALQTFSVDFSNDAQTDYQRFAFVKSLLEAPEFLEAVHRIVTYPVTTWSEQEEEKDIRKIRRISHGVTKQLAGTSKRFELPENHPLKSKLTSVPSKIKVRVKNEVVDNPENRFIKHALITFFQFCSNVRSRFNQKSRAYREALQLEEKFDNLLGHPIFKEISSPTTLKLNSPVLQRKEGYRELLRVWLMFDLAAKLIWKGGEDIYQAGKRDVAILYEYWVFFILLEILKDIFRMDSSSISELIQPTQDGLGLKLKSGKFIPFSGVFDTGSRKLKIEFSFNRTFTGNKDYPAGGSWTKDMRPDYTLSIWPYEISVTEAEIQELIVHIHFDAKYKVSELTEIVGEELEDLEAEKKEHREGVYKRADLLKMHAYKDAIRRSGGAYILYPGSISLKKVGFHELIPGLGAFSIKPSRTNNGTDSLKAFINEVLTHFLNRASQRERISYRVFDIHKEKSNNDLKEPIPELHNKVRVLPPDDINILIGYVKDQNHQAWIEENNLYNVRMDSVRGSLQLGPAEVGAKYLLLHSPGKLITGDIWEIVEKGPRIFSQEQMIKRGYLSPSQEFYLVYKIKRAKAEEFGNAKWNLKKLEEFKSNRGSSIPFAISLTNLMKGLNS